MKAAVWYGQKDIRVEKRELKEIGSNDVKVKVAWAGICGSDMHEYLHGPIFISEDKSSVVLSHEFSGVVEEYVKTMKLDYYTKKLTTESFLKLLLFAQLLEVESLHALSDCLFDDQLQKEIDLDSISISQLSRRLNGINPEIFQRIFLDLVTQIHEKTHYSKLVMPLKIIDSSTLPLNLTNHRWAEVRKTKAGVKLHLRLVFMEKGISYPEKSRFNECERT